MGKLLRLGLLAGPLLLGACASGPREEAPPPRAAPPPARAGTATGPVIGRTAAALQAQFGRPALDVREGTARKLQFRNAVCVLDAYLYPPAAGGEPIVTHIDTRLPDGRDIDPASCIASLSRR